MEPFVFSFPAKECLKKLQHRFGSRHLYNFVVKKGEIDDGCILDTFDNKIRSSRKLLLQLKHSLLLINLSNGQIARQQVISPWSFRSELEDGPVAEALGKVSRLRAFIIVTKISMQLDTGLVLDDEGKTRTRLYCFTMFRKKKSLQFGITQPLRGYEGAHSALRSRLMGAGADSAVDTGDIYSNLGIKQNEYSIKPAIILSCKDPIKHSATTIIATYLDVARKNVGGIVADVDTEFLHDYRVSFRKVRSLLSLFKGVFGIEQTVQLKHDFADLMKQTNRLRDLDVYLLDREAYFQMVPGSSHEGLNIMFDVIAGERDREHKRVYKMLKRKSYHQSMQGWLKLFSDGSSITSGPFAGEKANNYIGRLILKRYRKVCKIARAIDAATADEVVHELRIHCKKLRYLMEFSLPFFSRKKVKFLIKSLKTLQDNLGKFNDYSVQQISLGMFMSEMSLAGVKGMKVAESVGALTAMLYQLQCRERELVMENFTRFDSEKIHASFIALFRDKDCEK